MRVEWKNRSLGITVCHHSASLVMPNGDPRDRFFYPTLTLMMDSYNLPNGGLYQGKLMSIHYSIFELPSGGLYQKQK